MARKERVKAALFHGELTEVGPDYVSADGRSLGKPEKGLGGVTPKPTSVVPFTVTSATKIEVDDADGTIGDLVPGQYGIVKASGTLGDYTALLISVSNAEEEEEIEAPEESDGGVVDSVTPG